jgi:predicted phosphoribosyltransferase
MRFQDRREAGQQLAQRLMSHAGDPDALVLALPRGGVPVAYEVALALRAPLDIFLVRKLGVPGQVELAMGAIATGGVRILNQQVIEGLGIPEDIVDRVTANEQEELLRRERLYRGDNPPPKVRGRTVILIDDGLATGSTMRAAVAAVRRLKPAHLVVAVPVAAPSTYAEFQTEVEKVVCVHTPQPFHAVGLWYERFSQTTDEEIRELLIRAGEDFGAALSGE